jgi:2-polyprenyl-6-hydroxyphenyl methylase/3-demethylubiquinone-9 3-methyltransferase
MNDYYSKKLAADRLERAYEIAPPRIKQYLQAELAHILDLLKPSDTVLELGCGYGRILEPLCKKANFVVGIDTAINSLLSARSRMTAFSNCLFIGMDAGNLGFSSGIFNLTLCIQNGISAFHLSPEILIRESIRVTAGGGIVLYSSYTPEIWPSRLEWFKIQSDQGLLGPIDWELSTDGVIICKDGFKANTFGKNDFTRLVSPLGLPYKIYSIDQSSIFCEITVQ